MSAKMEFMSTIFRKMYFSKYSIKYVVNRLPPFKNLYDYTKGSERGNDNRKIKQPMYSRSYALID